MNNGMIKQIQKLQSDMLKAKKEIDETIFIGKSSLIEVEVSGEKKIKKISINSEICNKEFDEEEKEMLEDMLVVALNDAMNQIDKKTEEKMGKYTQGMPGLF